MTHRLFTAPANWAEWPSQSFPKYNVYTDPEESFFHGSDNNVEKGVTTIELALAGFRKKDINVTKTNRVLTIDGKITEGDTREYLYRGIAKRDFRISFQLLSHVEVISVKMDDGMLRIKLGRVLPDEEKPKVFEIY